jgi:hypothetical protein
MTLSRAVLTTGMIAVADTVLTVASTDANVVEMFGAATYRYQKRGRCRSASRHCEICQNDSTRVSSRLCAAQIQFRSKRSRSE